MSGVVINLNDDDEEDVAGLLDVDEVDEEDDVNEGLGLPRSKRRRRPFGRKINKPYSVVRGGTVGHLLNTLTLCCLFFGIGFSKSLLDESNVTFHPDTGTYQGPSTQKEMASAMGYTIGFVIAGFMLSKFSRLFILLLATSALGFTLIFVPWTRSTWAEDTVYTTIGVALAIVLTGGNVICLDYWGRKSGPYMQALHFCLSMGLLTGPFLISPISETKVPNWLQTAIKLSEQGLATAPVTLAPDAAKVTASGRSKRSLDTIDPIIRDLFAPRIILPHAIPGSTQSPSFLDIQREIQELRRDMETDGKIIEQLRSWKRPKRSFGRVNPNGDALGMGQPVIYGQSPRRIPYQPRGNWNRGDYGAPDYDMYGGGRLMEPFGPPEIEMNDFVPKAKEPPKKVEEAIDTISHYLAGDNITDEAKVSSTATTQQSTTTTTKIITSTSTRPTTTLRRTTTTKATSKTITFSVTPRTPSLPSSNSSGKPTIKDFVSQYGVSQHKLGFILNSLYDIGVALVLLVCLCYNPREPRSRQDDGRGRSEENRIFKYTITVLLFFFGLLHWGMFVSLQRVLPHFTILSSTAPYLQQVFIGVFTASRFVAMFTAGLLSPAIMVFGSLLVTFAGSLVLVFTQQVSATAVWGGVILQAVGLAALLPTSLVWCEAYVVMSAQVVAFICSGLALGELAVPQLFAKLTIEAQTWLGFAMLGATTLTTGLFVCVFLMAKKHGSRASRPQTSGYELASQEELNQDMIFDDDDEEAADDFEVSEPTLQLSAVDDVTQNL